MNFKFRELLLIFAVIIMLSVSFGIASVTAEKITEKAKKNTVASPELKVTVETTKEANKTNVNDLGMEFVLIPAGTFLMGSHDHLREAASDEKPQH
ncbi:hypothetical protein [Sporomusa sp.]|uniref:hypothetical protein n=1 Tax=Sporomusa sp. TaxID=2078658 RepID=UPI002C7EFF90|nr:hypothetical protein [Sporomusa sp.]HWR05691.1 hypothetical protein [Sporomusa sp.]